MSKLSDAIYLDDVPKNEWHNYIGDGYRSVYYTTDADRNGKIILFGFDKAGNRKTFVCPHQSRLKYNCKFKTDEIDIYDRYVTTKFFKNSYDRKKYMEAANGLNIIECMKPEAEFLHDMFDDVVLNDDFNKQKMRIHYLDIETEISDTFMPPSQADNRINMITLFDSETQKFYTWSLEHADRKFKDEPLCNEPIDKFVFFEFHNNEIALLEHFLNWYEDNYADVIYGWNVRAYDMPYIVRRIENVLGKESARKLSPVDKYFIKEVNHDNSRADVSADIEVEISGLFIADGLLFYRDKFMLSPALDGGYNLSNVGEAENLGRKIEYEGSLKDLYLQDYQKFYEYNVRDVDLCKRIDDKCNMISLARQIASFGLSNYGAIYSSIGYLIGSVISFSKTQMHKTFKSFMSEKLDFQGFEGAFVFPTVKGVYRGGIGTIDFASLYPSNIRSINASPETYVGKVLVFRKDSTGAVYQNVANPNTGAKDEKRFNIWKPGEEDENELHYDDPSIDHLELMLPNGQRKTITLEHIRELINTKCIYTANNTLFLKHEVKWGVIAKWCEYFYNLRKSTKKKMMKLFHLMHNEEEVAKMSEAEKHDNEVKIEVLDCMQHAYKIMINSIYGMLGTKFSPIANPHIAQSVTRQGRFCNMSTSAFIKERFTKYFKIPDDYVITISGDTDSQFINLDCVSSYLRNKRNLGKSIRKWKLDDRKALWKIVAQFVEKEVNPFVRNMVHDFCGTSQQDVLTYELEYMGDTGIYEGKKHYAVHKIFEEGDVVNKTKYCGIELKKAQLPKQMKNFLAEIYDGVITKEWGESEYNNYINSLYDKFKHFTIDDISLWKGYSSERQAVGFLQMATGTTGIAKACTYYNQIIDKLGLGKKYDHIRVGAKTRFCYLKSSNQFGIDCIAYLPDQWPKEFEKIFEVDYNVMFNKIILDPLKRFREACLFEDSDPSKQVVQDIFDL